jgi:hypothetical protein
MIEKGPLNSGIIVLSSARKPLYMNKAAQQLLSRLHRTENGSPVMPRSLDDLLEQILPLLKIGGRDRGWKQETTLVTIAHDRSVLVKTFGIPDRLDSQRSVIVLTIQDTQLS